MTARVFVGIFIGICLLGLGLIYAWLVHVGDLSFGGGDPAPLQYVSSASATSTGSDPSSLPPQVLLGDNYYAPQTFNNCGESALSMDMSFYGVNVSQQVLADLLRPDNNTTGHGDDKSTPPDEIAAGAENYGLIAFYRAGGTINLLKELTAAGFPVLTRTLFMSDEQVAHYRVVLGYNDSTGDIIEEDGFQGSNVTYSYSDFMNIWKYYDYEYIVLAKPSQEAQVEAILGPDANAATSWKDAAATAEQQLQQNPSDDLAEFNLSIANYYLGNYTQSVQEYQQAAPGLPSQTLWYRIEPLEAYYEVGDYSEVFTLGQQIIVQGNVAYPELYVVEGESYEKEGDTADAKTAFETALQYNKNLQSAQQGLASLGG